MRLPRLSALTVASVTFLSLMALPSLAADTLPTMPLRDNPVPPPAAGAQTSGEACVLGVVGTTTNDIGIIIPPGDEYYVLLDPQSCPTCPPGGQVLGSAHVMMRFSLGCGIPVTVSIVPAMEEPPGCLRPDREAEPLCGPMSYWIDAGNNPRSCRDVALPLAAGCCITEPVFLKVQFDPGTCPSGEPRFCTKDACDACTVFGYSESNPSLDDYCAVLPQFGIIMNADAQCCGTTPTLPGSWGRLKTLYR